jgi:hypothetical protein
MPDGKVSDYRSWYREVSRLCEEHIGVTLSDLPDLMTRDAFDNGTSPEDFFDEDVAELVMEEFGDLGATLIENYRKKRPPRRSILNPEVSYGKLD